MLIILFVAVVYHLIKQRGQPTSMISLIRSYIDYIRHHLKTKYFCHPYLYEDEIISRYMLGLYYWDDTGFSVKHAYVDDFFRSIVSI